MYTTYWPELDGQVPLNCKSPHLSYVSKCSTCKSGVCSLTYSQIYSFPSQIFQKLHPTLTLSPCPLCSKVLCYLHKLLYFTNSGPSQTKGMPEAPNIYISHNLIMPSKKMLLAPSQIKWGKATLGSSKNFRYLTPPSWSSCAQFFSATYKFCLNFKLTRERPKLQTIRQLKCV